MGAIMMLSTILLITIVGVVWIKVADKKHTPAH